MMLAKNIAKRTMLAVAFLLFSSALVCLAEGADAWPCFRGPRGCIAGWCAAWISNRARFSGSTKHMEDRYIAAGDAQTGEQRWRTARL
jgi:hypothetical protein